MDRDREDRERFFSGIFCGLYAMSVAFLYAENCYLTGLPFLDGVLVGVGVFGVIPGAILFPLAPIVRKKRYLAIVSGILGMAVGYALALVIHRLFPASGLLDEPAAMFIVPPPLGLPDFLGPVFVLCGFPLGCYAGFLVLEAKRKSGKT